MSDLVKITVDGIDYEVPAGANLLQTCLDLGIMVPHFCYHEALGPAGACRLCAAMVAPAKDKPARLEMTCMVRVADGMVVSVNDPYAVDFRRGILEYLMLNHPHDCPVCDEGGECMLQDMTILSGHAHRRSRFTKRTWKNQYLGPLIHHEMNRCITCYRCVRFYREYALGKDLGAFGSRDRVYFGRFQEGTLESEFAGNLVDVCPTGVFTNKRYRNVYARPWDLVTAHAVCVHCSVGCNLLPGGRHKTLRRIKPAPHKHVNRFFICDRGRFGGEYVNFWPQKTMALVEGRETSPARAAKLLAERLRSCVEKYGAESVVAITSARCSLETLAAQDILLQAVGAQPQIVVHDDDAAFETERFAAHVTLSRVLPVPSLVEIEKCDVIVSLGGDLTGEAPMIDLSVRQSIRAGGKFFVLSPRAGKLDEFARGSYIIRPDALAQAVASIAQAVEDKASTVAPEWSELVQALNQAHRPLVLCSTLHKDLPLAHAAFQLAQSLDSPERRCFLAYYFSQANSVGAAVLQNCIRPSQALEGLQAGKIKTALFVEPASGLTDREEELCTRLAKQCEFVAVIESVESRFAKQAHIFIPVLPHYFTAGKFVNYEGRAQYSQPLRLSLPLVDGPTDVLLTAITATGQQVCLEQVQFSDKFFFLPELNDALDHLAAGTEGLLLRGTSDPTPSNVAEASTGVSEKWTHWDIVTTFGSELLSSHSPPIAELAPEPYIEMHPADAAELGFREGEEITSPTDSRVRGKLIFNSQLARGTIAMPLLACTSLAKSLAEVQG